jgi:hypothetical protein
LLSQDALVGEARRLLRHIVQVSTCYGSRGDSQKVKLAMHTAYLDETGTGKKEKLCIVGGFVGNEAQWSSFIGEWIPALGPQRKNLHLSKLRWNRRYDKIKSDLAWLGPIPHRYNLSAVRVGMWHQDFEDFFKGKVRERFTNPYMACAQICIATVLSEIIGPQDEIAFIFDRQEGQRARTIEMLEKTAFQLAKMEPRIKDIGFRPMWSTVCLDPADYLVFALRENLLDKTSKKALATAPILTNKMWGGILTREQVQKMAEHYIAHGMVPGTRSFKMSDQLAAALLKAGWSELQVKTIALRAQHGLPAINEGELPANGQHRIR